MDVLAASIGCQKRGRGRGFGGGFEPETHQSGSGRFGGPENATINRAMVWDGGAAATVATDVLAASIGTEAEAVWGGFQVAAEKSDMAELWLVVAWVVEGSACVRVVMENGESCSRVNKKGFPLYYFVADLAKVG